MLQVTPSPPKTHQNQARTLSVRFATKFFKAGSSTTSFISSWDHQGCWLNNPPAILVSEHQHPEVVQNVLHQSIHHIILSKSWGPRFLICKDIKSQGPRLCLQHICKWNTEKSKNPSHFYPNFFGVLLDIFWGDNTHLKVDSNQHGLPARHLHWWWILVEVMCKASHDLLAEDVDRHVTGAARPR